MKYRSLLTHFVSISWMLVVAILILPARPAQAFLGAQGERDVAQQVADTEIWTSVVISNEAPGHLVDHLIAAGFGDETLFEVLVYLKSQSNGVISDEWFNQVAAAGAGSEVFTATLGNYAGLIGGIEIAADGTISIPDILGSNYVGTTGYSFQRSLDHRFYLTYSADANHYIYTHTNEYGGGVTRAYYAFAIAWSSEPVLSIVLSNEPAGHLVDHLITAGFGDNTLFEVLGYLKSQSNGVISDEWYNKVAAAGAGSEVFTATLGNYAGMNGGIEIAADGTLSIPTVNGQDFTALSGYQTATSLDGSFNFTSAQDLIHNIYTHSKTYSTGVYKEYFAFAIAWDPGVQLYLPIILK